MLLALLVACNQDPTPAEVVTSGPDGQPAACQALFSVVLGDVSRGIAAGGEPPDTAMAFSPDGTRLAIGAGTGEVLIVDGFTGERLVSRDLPEAVPREVAWAADGQTLYVAEQSGDALLHAVDPATLADRWTVALADHVERSAPPAGDDLYGIYTLPGPYGLVALDGGDVIVSAVHGWYDGVRKNRARLLRIGPQGEVVAAWPPAGAADATLFHPHVDAASGRIAVPVGRSADGPLPADIPVDSLLVLDVATLTPVAAIQAAPLEPYYERVFAWEGTGIDGDLAWMGLGDGRLMAFHADGAARYEADLGTPIAAGGVPIAVSIGHVGRAGSYLVATTGRSDIPYGAADPSLRPPVAHPSENTVSWLDDSGRVAFSWSGPYSLQGLAIAGDTVVVGGGTRFTDDRRDLFGAVVLRDGEVVTVCPTASPVTIGLRALADGRIAVAEHPWRTADGVEGDYRVTVVR